MKRIFQLAVLLMLCGMGIVQAQIKPAQAGVNYGKTITAQNAINTEVLNKALLTDSVYNGKITGRVIEVCKKKGCFMKLEQANGAPIMVQFTDYAYFMPQDIVGKTVVVEGKAKLKETPVERLRHYAADAGKIKEEIAAIKEPKRDIGIIADGVLVVK